MEQQQRILIRRGDYAPPSYLTPDIRLDIDLDDTETLVRTVMSVVRNAGVDAGTPLVLDCEGLEFQSVSIDGKRLGSGDFTLFPHALTIHSVLERCEIITEHSLNPSANMSLEGLYKSGNIFCTQNEPEGFRRITYSIDRPDNMARIITVLTGSASQCPVMLANGNCVSSEDLPGGRKRVTWVDPFPKPCYLFAVVGGDLGLLSDRFTTKSGKNVELRIYCDPGNEDKCAHAMESLKKSMRWDEERFGLEYDLDTYMIVAVGSFNMGAMENKGLNIFNSQYILADPSTATDANYLNIDRVVAHEYFHNWTGNRVTCRDWFQLTLKEGLTVFRDQEFSSDVHSRQVKRIEDVNKLRIFQFPEDSGPNAHPIRPESYMEINNFYTVTIYEKGAEVIRMIHLLLGEERFQLGMKRYFELYDGMAVTCDDFVKAMEDGGGEDLSQFMRWYEQAGTPVVEIRSRHDAKSGKMRIDLKQESAGAPLHIPFRIGIVAADGGDLLGDGDESSIVLELRKERETFEFDNIPKGAVLSVNRGFSAPVRVQYERSMEELFFLFSRDSDPFNRWDAGQEAAIQVLREMICERSGKGAMNVPRNYLEAWASVLSIPDMPLYFKSQLLRLPSEQVIAQEYEIIDFDAIHDARTELKRVIGATCRARLMETYRALDTGGGYLTDMRSIGMRDLRLLCLDYLVSTGDTADLELCSQHFSEASNMTDEAGALAILADVEHPIADAAIAGFYERWKSNALVMMKWFSVQALSSRTTTLDTVIRLERDPAFDVRVPNLVRSLTGAFAQNAVRFNDAGGRGYGYVADRIVELDSFNPSMSSMLAKSFKLYNRVDPQRRERMKKALERVLNVTSLSKNAFEIVSKTLNRG